MIPFLKGIHQTIDSWRPNHHQDGWKMTDKEWILILADIEDEKEKDRLLNLHSAGHPERVKIAERLRDDLRAL